MGRIVEQDLDVIKVASCSFTDWPLLEEIAKTAKPVIASTAEVSITDIKSFFLKNRSSSRSLYCVGQYPTPNADLEIGQIEFLRNRYSDVTVADARRSQQYRDKLAIAKGPVFLRNILGLLMRMFKCLFHQPESGRFGFSLSRSL